MSPDGTDITALRVIGGLLHCFTLRAVYIVVRRHETRWRAVPVETVRGWRNFSRLERDEGDGRMPRGFYTQRRTMPVGKEP